MLDKILLKSWQYYKGIKLDAKTGRPLADEDKLGFSGSHKKTFMTFSETVSYALFRAVWVKDKETFDKVWQWAYKNLWRKNINDVFSWQIDKWIDMPKSRKDNLFAWRFVDDIKNSNNGGVIYFTWNENDSLWRDGLDCAPDGDELIAGSLIMAHCLWGSQSGIFDYLEHAKMIVPEIWQKCVKYIIPGLIDDFSKRDNIRSWFTYQSDNSLLTKTLARMDNNNSCLEVNYFIPNANWAGIGKKLNNVDFSKTKGLSFFCRGKQNHKLKIIIQGSSLSNKNLKEKAFFAINLKEKGQDYNIEFKDFLNHELVNWHEIDSLLIQADDNGQTGFFCLQSISLYQSELFGRPEYHLTSNDKGEQTINLSYYMPFLYDSFQKIDPKNPWHKLIDSCYNDVQLGAKATLLDENNNLHTGMGGLIPDWFTITATGKPGNLPWRNSLTGDDCFHSWDAFRFDFFSALDLVWHNSKPAKNYIYQDGPYQFYKNELIKYGKINKGYTIDGRKVNNHRGMDSDGFGFYGSYLSLFLAKNDQEFSKKILDLMQKSYNQTGFWGQDLEEYFQQNWAWLGLAFYLNQGLHLKEALNKL